MPSVRSSSPRIVPSIPARQTANHINQMIARGFFSNLLDGAQNWIARVETKMPLLRAAFSFLTSDEFYMGAV